MSRNTSDTAKAIGEALNAHQDGGTPFATLVGQFLYPHDKVWAEKFTDMINETFVGEDENYADAITYDV